MFKYRDYTSLSSCQICSFERIFFPSKSTFCCEKEKCRDEEKPEYCNVGGLAVHCGKLRHASSQKTLILNLSSFKCWTVNNIMYNAEVILIWLDNFAECSEMYWSVGSVAIMAVAVIQATGRTELEEYVCILGILAS